MSHSISLTIKECTLKSNKFFNERRRKRRCNILREVRPPGKQRFFFLLFHFWIGNLVSWEGWDLTTSSVGSGLRHSCGCLKSYYSFKDEEVNNQFLDTAKRITPKREMRIGDPQKGEKMTDRVRERNQSLFLEGKVQRTNPLNHSISSGSQVRGTSTMTQNIQSGGSGPKKKKRK